ncbi:MATE family efflux transporter [Thiomicrorhabdus sp.]|uniref:MATE family efflux transporter n=1 Tax=Thiomicrorhabdus sp. TaxID=2039724 RepID=UPI003563EEA4
MSLARQLLDESKLLTKLALPIFFAQLALTALGVVDTIMSGWVGTDDLAAIGLGSSILLPVFIFSTGILLALTPLVSKQYGAGNPAAVTRYFHQGLWLSIPLGIISLTVLMNLEGILVWLELSKPVYTLTDDYLFYIAFGMPGIVLYQALRFFWEGLGTTLPSMWISFMALVVNVPLNALFIYGYGIVEPMGAAGCGVASAISMWLMFAVGLVYVMRASLTRSLVHFKQLRWPVWKQGVADIFNLGVPNALALIFEVSLFSFIALFIAQLGAVVIAGHQVAISITSVTFMLPLSIAMAITVRVGKGYGENNQQAVLISLYAGIGFAALLGFVMSLFTYLLRDQLVAVYSKDNEVMLLASILLVYAACYQVFDAVQVACAGGLRGLHDTRVTMVVTFISYWGIGLAGGYALAFTNWFTETPMGVQGFWFGIVIGLLLAAILLLWRLKGQFYARFH